MLHEHTKLVLNGYKIKRLQSDLGNRSMDTGRAYAYDKSGYFGNNL